MNYFEEGERLKAAFDSLIMQHKKTKKALESNGMDEEALRKHEDVRAEIMRFFRENHGFIRPRKNSFGAFSVEDFVKSKVRETASFSNWMGDRGPVEDPYVPDARRYPSPYEGRGDVVHRRNTVSGVLPFYGPSSPSTSVWRNPEQSRQPKVAGDDLVRHQREEQGLYSDRR